MQHDRAGSFPAPRRPPQAEKDTRFMVGVTNDDGLLGMSEPELYGYLNDLFHEEAAEAAEVSGKTVEEELDSAGFAAAAAASTYAIKLILANNAYVTRQLLDLGVLSVAEPAE
jgi:hypothetical protein